MACSMTQKINIEFPGSATNGHPINRVQPSSTCFAVSSPARFSAHLKKNLSDRATNSKNMASYFDEHNCVPLRDGETPDHFLHMAR